MPGIRPGPPATATATASATASVPQCASRYCEHLQHCSPQLVPDLHWAVCHCPPAPLPHPWHHFAPPDRPVNLFRTSGWTRPPIDSQVSWSTSETWPTASASIYKYSSTAIDPTITELAFKNHHLVANIPCHRPSHSESCTLHLCAPSL